MKDVKENVVNVCENYASEDALGDSCKTEDNFKDWKDSVKSEAIRNENEKVLAKTDGMMGNMKKEAVIDKIEDIVLSKTITSTDTDDSSEGSSDEESAEEYMSDGEVVRKNKRGFKQLNNCKRFWKASLMIGNRKFNSLIQ